MRSARAVPVLENRYELQELLGQGNFASVYAARNRALGSPAAVKILNPDLTDDAGFVDGFEREASLTSRIASPNVVKVLGRAVTKRGAPCIAYELLRGETLTSAISRTGGLTLAATVHIVREIARGLDDIHELGIVHRDMKPANVFLVESPAGRPRVKLIDFGLAELVAARQSGVLSTAGTPEYMPPEILWGLEAASARADIYALGAIAFECLTGEIMFGADDVDAVIDAVSFGPRRSVLASRPDLPSSLDACIQRAVHPDPRMRFASGAELVAALAAVVAGRSSLRCAA